MFFMEGEIGVIHVSMNKALYYRDSIFLTRGFEKGMDKTSGVGPSQSDW